MDDQATRLRMLVDGKKAGYAILATAAMAFILLGISLITKDILIPIGKMWPEALIGAGVVLGIIAIFGTVLFLLGKFADKFAVELAIGAIIMTAVAVVMLATGTACLLFAYEAKKIDELNKGGAVFLGAATAEWTQVGDANNIDDLYAAGAIVGKS